MHLTSLRQLVLAAVVGAVGAWILASVVRLISGLPLHLGWSAPVALLIIAGAVAAIAVGAWSRLRRVRARIDPQRAVMLLALGKSAALGGALLAGGYLAFAVLSVGDVALPAPRDRVIRSLVAVIGGVGVMVAGLILERACRVIDDSDEGGGAGELSAETE